MGRQELFTEMPEAGEKKLALALSEVVLSRMNKLYGNSPQALRDTHAKTHAGVSASLTIMDFDEDAIKQAVLRHSTIEREALESVSLKLGLLATPATYPVWLRFANGGPNVTHDYTPDTRSMAVKVIGVQGTRLMQSHEEHTQDIIVQNAEIFFIKSIRSYVGFFNSISKSTLRNVLWLLTHPLQLLALLRITRGQQPRSLLTERYWSGSASALGLPDSFDPSDPGTVPVRYPLVLKYAFTPVASEPPHNRIPEVIRSKDSIREAKAAAKKGAQDNYYRKEVAQALAEPNANHQWDFQIQIQTKASQSIDDVTKVWPEDEAPFHTVGRLTVGPQQVDNPERQRFAEELQFSPWNGLAVHRPVGALNRLRSYVYPIVRDFRQDKLDHDYQEPTG